MFKKIIFIMLIVSFTAYPTVPVLAQELSGPQQNPNQTISENQNENVNFVSPDFNGDFLNQENNETAPDPAGIAPIEKKEGAFLENPAGTAPSDTSGETPEEPPVTDDPPMSPHQYSEGVNGTVEKSKFNKASGEMQVDSFSGAVTYNYTFDLPPGRNGLQPNLGLNYSSQLKNFGNLVGLGWELPLVDIHREYKYGITNNNSRYFGLNFYGNNQEIFPKTLEPDGLHGEYTAKNSDFSLIEFLTDASFSDYWKIVDKNGTVYKIGLTSGSRLESMTYPGDIEKTSKWLIDEARDTNDNFIKFEYYKDNELYQPEYYNNQIYPYRIYYTGHGTTNGNLLIQFNRVLRTDINTSYEYRLWITPVITKYIINNIEIYANSELKKKYNLAYGTGDNAITSVLNSIQEIGLENGQELSRPATTFEYTTKQRSFVNNGDWKSPNFAVTQMTAGPTGSSDLGVRIFDVQGDGLADILKYGPVNEAFHGETHTTTYLNNGINGWRDVPSCSLPLSFTQNYNNLPGDSGVRAIDLNADGLTDLVKSWKNGSTWIRQTFYNKGNCVFEPTDDYLLPVAIYDYINGGQNVNFVDMNNDGFIDIAGQYWNNGKNGWTNWNGFIWPLDDADDGIRYADVNGDGYADKLSNTNTYLNTGYVGDLQTTGNWHTPVPFVVPGSEPNTTRDNGVRLADMNGDGLVDIVASSFVYLNDGVESFDLTGWALPSGTGFIHNQGDTGVRLADVNGDNLVDLVQARYELYQSGPENPEGIKNTWLAESAVPNILKSVNNGYGKSDEFSYKTSVDYLNAEGIESIPFTGSAYVDSNDPTNHQTGTLKTGYFGFGYQERWITYVKPDLSAVPAGNNIFSFRLKLQASNAGGLSNLSVYQINSSWDPETVTWNTKPSTGNLLCSRVNLVTGFWTFWCQGPISQNGIAIKAVPNGPANNPSADLNSIEIRDLVYQTDESYNPNAGLDSTMQVVDQTKTNNGDDGIVDYKYNNGAKSVNLSSITIGEQINLSEPQSWNNDWQSQYIAKAGQIFKVNATGDYNLAKVWLTRSNGPQATNVTFFIATIYYEQQKGVYQPNTILTSATMPASNLCPYTSNPNDCAVTINFPNTVNLGAGTHYWLGIIGDPYIGVYFKYGHTSNSGAYNCSSEICNFSYFETNPGSWYYNYYYPYGDMRFQIGKQAYQVIRQNYEFSGFGKVETTDQDNNKNITYFHQGGGLDGSAVGEFEDSYAKRGKPFRTENYDSNDNLLSQTINKWKADETFINPDYAATSTFVYLDQSVNSIFNNSSDHKDTATTYTYDFDNGNLLTELNKGEGTANIQTGEFTDNPGDEKLTTYEYAVSDEDLHILGAPMNKVISDPNSTSQVQQDYYYDNLPLGEVDHLNVTKEDLPTQTIDYEYTYNDYGLVTQKKDPYDNTTTITYDQYNLYPITTTNALNQIVETTYDLYTGQLLESTDPNGLVAQNDYDALGRLVEVKTSDPQNPSQLIIREIYEYHDTDSPWWIRHSVYSTTTAAAIDSYSYFDGFGRAIQERTETGTVNQLSVISYQYDERGNLSKQSLPYFETGTPYIAPNWINIPKNEYTYDGLNRVLTVVNSLGTTSNSYDLWKTTITDANNKSKNIYHDAHNRLVKVDEILNSTTYPTTYTYNYLDKITNITDSQNNTRNFVYDDLGRLTGQEEMHIPSSQTFGIWEYEYDLNSNLVEKTDPKNQVVNYTYDDLNRILTEDYTGTTGVDNSYVYDQGTNGIGRLISVTKNTNPVVSTSYIYDLLGRVSTENKNIKGRDFNTSYTYDLLNNPSTIIYPENFQVRYGYNNIGQTNQVYYTAPNQAEQQIISSVNYSPLAQISQLNYTNGTVVNNTYDPNELYRLTAKQTVKSGTNLQNIAYEYDPVGNITQIIDTSPNQLAKTADYIYDDLYRLITATITTSTVTTLTFSYDPIGNITAKSDLGNYIYGNSNPYQTNQINNVNQVYDNNGNLINETQRTMAYDYQDRMSSVNVRNQTTNYYYDHGKTRIAKLNSQTGAYTEYPNKYFEKSNNKKDWYIFLGNQRLGIFEATTTSALLLNFTDHLNSSSVTTDANGNISNLNDYLPYGGDRVNVKLGSFSPTYKFTDQESDVESGIMYYGARYYDQRIGKFVQIDPVSFLFHDDKQLKEKTGMTLNQLLENPQALNNYSYAVNNPIKYVDPNGEWFREFFTGRQSWSSFQMEIGQAAMYMSPTWQTAMDHPYITGAAVGVAGGLAAVGGSYLLGQGGLTLLRAAPLGGSPIVKNIDKTFNKLDNAAKGAYDIAVSGGKNFGIIQNSLKNNMTVNRIQQSIDSLRQNAIEHLGWIKNPSTYSKYYTEFVNKSAKGQVDTLNYWYGEAQRYIEQSNVYQGILENLQK